MAPRLRERGEGHAPHDKDDLLRPRAVDLIVQGMALQRRRLVPDFGDRTEALACAGCGVKNGGRGLEALRG